MFVGYVKPFALPQVNTVELINETLTLLTTYSLFLFTDFVPDAQVRYTMGWAVIFLTLMLVVTNLYVILHKTVKTVSLKGKIKYKKYVYERKSQEIEDERKAREKVKELVELTL